MPTLSATSLRTFWRPEEIFGRHSRLIWLTLRRTGPSGHQRIEAKAHLESDSATPEPRIIEPLNPQPSQAQAQ